MIITERRRLMGVLARHLPFDEVAAIDMALQVSVFVTFAASPLASALAHGIRLQLMDGSTDPRVIITKWHADHATALLACAEPGTARHAQLALALDEIATRYAEVRVCFPPVGTPLQ